MKSSVRFLLILACLIVLPMIAFAQDTSANQNVDLGDGYTITVPADWTLTKVNDGVVTLKGASLSVTVTTPTRLKALGFDFPHGTVLADVLASVYLTPNPIDESNVKAVLYDQRRAAVYNNFGAPAADQQVVVLTLSDGNFGYLLFTAAKGQITAQKTQIEAIIASFDSQTSGGNNPQTNSGAAGVTGTAEAGTDGSATTGGGTEVNCTVSADKANTAQLRVGPGTNRGAISFLATGVQVTVTGRTVLANKTVWYQLDKSEAAPKGTSAAQLWVAATQVTATGDCDHVGDASAPPVIPGNVAPPPANNGGNGNQGSTNSAPGSLPTAGSWNLTFNATTNASCQGYQNVPIPSTEIFDSLTFNYSMFIINSNSFNYGQDVFTRIPGTNSFAGSFTFPDGTNAQIRFDMTSATSMFGQAVVNFTQDNTPCSATSLFLTTHR